MSAALPDDMRPPMYKYILQLSIGDLACVMARNGCGGDYICRAHYIVATTVERRWYGCCQNCLNTLLLVTPDKTFYRLGFHGFFPGHERQHSLVVCDGKTFTVYEGKS